MPIVEMSIPLNRFFQDQYIKTYKDGVCEKLSKDEYRTFYYYNRYKSYYLDGFDVYETEFFSWNVMFGKIPTDDKELIEGKTYFGSDNQIISSPKQEEISSYYEEAQLFSVYYDLEHTSGVIEGTTYYEYNMIDEHYDRVTNPNDEDIDMYNIKVDFPHVKLFTLDETKFSAILEDYYLVEVFKDEGMPTIVAFKAVEDEDEYRFFNLNGEEVLIGNQVINFYGDNLIGVLDINEGLNTDWNSFKFLNKDYEEIYDPNIDHIIGGNNLSGNTYVMRGSNPDSTRLYYLTVYKTIGGNNSKYDDKDLTMKFSGELSRLNSVKINGTELDEKNYTKTNGSTSITLKKEYLDTLKKGTYTLKVEYSDGGYASASFTVPEKNPETLDGIMTYILLAGISLIGITGSILYLKKSLIKELSKM